MPFDGPTPASLLPAVTTALLHGRDRIANGWCRNRMSMSTWSLGGRRPHYCMVGAIATAPQYGAAAYLAKAIDEIGVVYETNARWSEKYQRELLTVMLFNDFPGRTQGECLAIYDRAIELSLEAAQ